MFAEPIVPAIDEPDSLLPAIHRDLRPAAEFPSSPPSASSPFWSREERIRKAFEFAASGMAIADLDGHFKESNSAYREIVDRTQQELNSETVLSITHPEDRENCRQHLGRLGSGRLTAFVLENRYIRPDKKVVWVRTSFSVMKDDQGIPSHIILGCNDITEQRRLERLSLESEKLTVVGRLAASIAHEINNPLEAALNLVYLVRTADDLDEARRLAAQAEEEIQRLAHVATHTLQFHKQLTKPTSINMVTLLDSLLALFKDKLDLASIKVQFEAQDDLELVCYSGDIRQILASLVQNAIEAMPNGGILRIRSKRGIDWRTRVPEVRITLADTGYGMSAETRSRIYDPFFTTKGSVGNGLGLWVTAGILARYQGRMHVRSSAIPGASGTVFTLILPLGCQAQAADCPKRTS